MGTPIPPPGPVDPVAPGFDCVSCWGFEKPFGNVETPSSIDVEFDGIAKGPNWIPADGDAPEGSFTLPQFDEGFPCLFEDENAFNISIGFLEGSTSVQASKSGGNSFFSTVTNQPCMTVIANDLDDHFTGGTATITIPETD